MKLAIFGSPIAWHAQDLVRAARQRGIDTKIIDFRSIWAAVNSEPPDWFSTDVAIVRTMPPGSLEQVVFRMDALHMLERRGTYVFNSPRSLELCIDKYLATAILDNAGLPVPRTVMCQTAEAALNAFETLGNDVVVKPVFGSEGRGILRVSDRELAWRVFRALERTHQTIYVQEFIAHPGWDCRVFLLGGRVVACMRRYHSDWRTNVARGAKGEAFVPPDGVIDLAGRAADAAGVAVAGVDLLLGPDDRWYILEINAVPGWRAIAKACEIDVADRIVTWLIHR